MKLEKVNGFVHKNWTGFIRVCGGIIRFSFQKNWHVHNVEKMILYLQLKLLFNQSTVYSPKSHGHDSVHVHDSVYRIGGKNGSPIRKANNKMLPLSCQKKISLATFFFCIGKRWHNWISQRPSCPLRTEILYPRTKPKLQQKWPPRRNKCEKSMLLVWLFELSTVFIRTFQFLFVTCFFWDLFCHFLMYIYL